MSTPEQKEKIDLNTAEHPSEQEKPSEQKKIVERLKSLISESGSSQAKFGEECGIRKDRLSKILRCKASLGVQDAIRISKKHSISIDYLLGISTIKKPHETVYSLLTQHISPYLSPYTPKQSSDGDSYRIPALKVSAEFLEYMRGIWEVQRSTAPENVKKQWKEAIENELLEKINTTPDMEQGAKYAAIPLERVEDSHILDDLDIHPENSLD